MKFLIQVLVISSLFVNCKEKQTEFTNPTEKNHEKSAEEQINFFSFTLNAIVEQDEELFLYYLEVNQKEINKEHSVFVNVSGNNSSQKIKFELENDILPTKLILKFGNSSENQKVKIESASLNYHEKQIFIDKTFFYQYFIPNENIDYNLENYSFTFQKVNHKIEPAFFSRNVLENQIDYIFYK